MSSFGTRKTLGISYDEALAKVPEALKSEGFGVLTEIDVRQTLKNKLGVDFRRYKILGACNPPFAHQALQQELEVGLLMPCNVIVYEDDEGRTVVSAVDPVQTIAAQARPEMKAIAEAVQQKLARVLERLG